jgi:hypothetical protein
MPFAMAGTVLDRSNAEALQFESRLEHGLLPPLLPLSCV